MRLIDADELKECLHWCEVCRLSIKEICDDYIDTAPTVEERPQGKWTTKRCSLEITCSVCNKGYFYHPKNHFYYNFCPHCGADMRGNDNG